MVFFSQQEFLAAEARKTQMEVRGKTPPLPPGAVHPPEHERLKVQSLLDSIPETLPGPNAFARRVEMMEKKKIQRRGGSVSAFQPRGEHVGYPVKAVKDRREASTSSKPGSLKSHLPTHSVYQAALTSATAHPPADIHPAFRNRSMSHPPTPPRDSDCTDITEFIKAGMEDSPKLKLNATPNLLTEPTFRARVEERNGHDTHVKYADDLQSVPVFHPTPKMPGAQDFTQRPGTPADALAKDDTHSKGAVKTPRKGLLAKLKLSTTSRSANSLATGELSTDPADQMEDKVPVKAQALLGESPRKHKHHGSLGSPPAKMLLRSPSKRSKFFSRKNVDNVELQRPSTAGLQMQRPSDMPSITVSDIPQTAISVPTHFSDDGRRVVSRNRSEDIYGKQAVQQSQMMTRSKSVNLRHFDGVVPPTPPAKNTPPHEKAMKDAKGVREMQDAMNLLTLERQNLIGGGQNIFNSDSNTPTRFGTGAFRDGPNLMSKTSMCSLHASIVPDELEASTIEEMEARIGGLDIEGFNSPTDRIVSRSNIHEAVYSPSNYSLNGGFSPRATPMLQQEEKQMKTALSPRSNSFSSSGTITITYLDLPNDPSYIRNTAAQKAKEEASHSHSRSGGTHLSPELTSHGRTHSRDHLNSDSQAIFAQHVDNQEHRHAVYNSPSAYSHTSAMPPPLQYLPATTYVPPPKRMKKGNEAVQADPDLSQDTSSSDRAVKPRCESGLGIQTGGSSDAKGSEGDSDSLFAIRPARQTMSSRTKAQSLQSVFELAAGPASANIHSQMKAVSRSGASDNKLDIVVDILNKRNSEINDLREVVLEKHTSELNAMREELRGASGVKFDAMVDILNKRNSELNDMREDVRASDARNAASAQEEATAILSLPTNKLDTVLEVLNRRNSDVHALRDEVCNEFHDNNARLDQRLLAVESLRQDSSSIKPAVMVYNHATGDTSAQFKAKRISTDAAHEFYRSGMATTEQQQTAGGVAVAGPSRAEGVDDTEVDGVDKAASVGAPAGEDKGGGQAEGESETIKQLQETNKQLLAMVAKFAGKLEALEAKVGKSSG